MINVLKKFTIFISLIFCINAYAEIDPDIIEETENSVLSIQIINSQEERELGTGFIIKKSANSNEYFVVTNAHVIANTAMNFVYAAIKIQSDAEGIYEFYGNIIKFDERRDLALLKVEFAQNSPNTFEFQPLKISSAELSKGQNVWATGYPGIADAINMSSDSFAFDIPRPSTSEGHIGKIEMGSWDPLFGDAPIKIIQHSAAINGGNSGGPLLDQCGSVIGVNTLKPRVSTNSDGVFWSLESTELIAFLSENGIKPEIVEQTCKTGLAAIPYWVWIAIGVAFLLIIIVIIGLIFLPRSGSTPLSHSQAKLLVIQQSSGTKSKFSMQKLQNGVKIGRAPGNDIVINAPQVSRIHGELKIIGTKLTYQDFNSQNGSTIDGQNTPSNQAIPISTKSILSVAGNPLILQKI